MLVLILKKKKPQKKRALELLLTSQVKSPDLEILFPVNLMICLCGKTRKCKIFIDLGLEIIMGFTNKNETGL